MRDSEKVDKWLIDKDSDVSWILALGLPYVFIMLPIGVWLHPEPAQSGGEFLLILFIALAGFFGPVWIFVNILSWCKRR